MDFSAYKILVADDHSLLRHMINNVLRPFSAKPVDWANDGAEALQKIKTQCAQKKPYDVVFLDWNMPGMNGFDVLSACRSDRSLDRTAIIMLTAESETDNIVKAIETGATAYIIKPFQPEAIIEKLENIASWQNKPQQA